MDDGGFWGRLTLAALAAWRLTHLIAEEDGPGGAVLRVRAWLGDGFAGKLMDCFYCVSVWVAAPAALLVARRPGTRGLAWLAISGAACLLERATREAVAVRPEIEVLSSEGGTIDGVLRTGTGGPTSGASIGQTRGGAATGESAATH